MPSYLKIAYFAHSIRSDWNNGNAHFLRGLMRALAKAGHNVLVFESSIGWSIDHLRQESGGEASLQAFNALYSDVSITLYDCNSEEPEQWLRHHLCGFDIVILHEWNTPDLAQTLLAIRQQTGFKLLFHDTHHRASSSPAQMQRFGLNRFDGVIAFGSALCEIYRVHFGLKRVWVLHEAADTTIFKPQPEITRNNEIVWIGNWGDDERAEEIREYLLEPARSLQDEAKTNVYGVRYPESALHALAQAGVDYRGYLPNLDAPRIYASAAVTVHIPRQQYKQAMDGIPTIRVFEALASGIPLVSAPWKDSETMFRMGDFCWADDSREMMRVLHSLLSDKVAAQEQADRGLETILERHTCAHRAMELIEICHEVMQ